MQLIGQQNNLEIIKKWDKLPNFIIIQGEEHTGKNYFVLYLCKMFGLQYVKVPKTVKEIRNLVTLMTKNSNVVYHLDNFDSASLQAKNALLKVTEEPKEGNYIIITGGPQIKTLQSRARVIIMSPYKYEELKDLYNKYYLGLDSFKLYNVGINTPAKIELYRNCSQLKDLLECVYNIFDRITYIDVNDYLPILKLFENRYDKDSVDLCMLFLNMLICLIEYKILEGNYQYSYYEILNIIINIKNQLQYEFTLNRKLLILKMFYRIQDMELNQNRGV